MANTIECHIEEFADSLRDKDKSESTVTAYKTDLRLFAEWLGGLPVDGVKARHVIHYRNELNRIRRSPATINRRLVSILVFFDWAKEMGLSENNPAKNVNLIALEPADPKSMNSADMERLMDTVRAANNTRDVAIFTLLLNTGIRVGELCSLKVGDLDLCSVAPRLQVWNGKGRKNRIVNLNDSCLDVINTYLNIRQPKETDYLFCSQKSISQKSKNKPPNITTRGIAHLVTSYCHRAGIKPVSPHVFRHTRAKSLIDAGFSIDRVAKILGHSSIETTKIYTNPTEADLLSMLNSVPL